MAAIVAAAATPARMMVSILSKGLLILSASRCRQTHLIERRDC